MIIEDTKLDFDDVLIVPQPTFFSSRSEANVIRKFEINGQVLEGTPIISANMSTVTTIEMAKAMAKMNMFSALNKHIPYEELLKFFNESEQYVYDRTFLTIGLHDIVLLKKLIADTIPGRTPKLICLDVANGYMHKFCKLIFEVRNLLSNSVILAGNVVTPEGCKRLIDVGADIIKIGIGSSAVCRTRTVAGVGIPQFSAIMDCVEEIHKRGAYLCSDGGCKVPADFCKAFGGGADFVMAGTILAGHDESGGQRIGDKIEFYGMSSEAAMNNHNNGMPKYRSSEGIRVLVDYKGPVEKTLNNILGGIRSCMSYTNTFNLQYLSNNVTFARTNRTHSKIFGE